MRSFSYTPYKSRCSTVRTADSAVLLGIIACTATGARAQTIYTFSSIASFTGTNGIYALSGVTLDSAGNIYGTTEAGGANSSGTLYKIAAGTNTITTLYNFAGTDGQYPRSDLTFDSAGNLYGTTETGGANNYGTAFQFATGTNTLSTIASFDSASGEFPRSAAIFDSAGNMYGTTPNGGTEGVGTVYKIAAGTNTITTLANFSFNGSNGSIPYSSLVMDSAGNLYGTTYSGGANDTGTIFKIAAGTNSLTTLYSFDGTNGSGPFAGLTLDSAGNLYGTTIFDGANGYGGIFELAAGTSTLTTLASFSSSEGYDSYGNLTMDSAGNLYGTTASGGVNGDGTVYKIDAVTNALTTLYSFNYTDGYYPVAGLTLDSAGNIYGTTAGGGTHGDGTVFKIDAGTNALSTLYSFSGTDGATLFGALTFDNSGNIYGTTLSGGANNDGTVFKLALNDTVAAPEPGALPLILTAALPLVGMLRARRKRA